MRGHIGDDLFDLRAGLGEHDQIRQGIEAAVAQAQQVVHRLPVGDGKAVVIALRDVLFADDGGDGGDVRRVDFGRVLRPELDRLHADIVVILPEVVVGEIASGFHILIQALLGIFEEIRVAPAEDGAVAVLGRAVQHPVRLEAAVRFCAHFVVLLLISAMDLSIGRSLAGSRL